MSLIIILPSCQSDADIPPKNELCPAISQLLTAADQDFQPIKGRFIRLDSLDEIYECKVHIPGSTSNELAYNKDEVPQYTTTLGFGTDSLEAYRHYLSATLQFMECQPQYKYGDKQKYDSLDDPAYGVYVFRDKIVYISFGKDHGGGRNFFVMFIVTLDPDSKYYKR